MKHFSLLLLIIFSFLGLLAQEVSADSTGLEPVEVMAIRATTKNPFAKTNISKTTLAQNNLGQDIPFLLQQSPSVVVNSDAGNGVGYTGMRIRGSDASRINITLNGVPFNDAESQGTFLVNLPDFASSVSSVQIQRGVGTSSNGAGAFGASVNLLTNEVNKTAYAEVNNSFGSFHTIKNTLKAGSGLIGKYFTLEARISAIVSDGYIDRASSKLQSQYFSALFLKGNTSIRLNIINGKEKTYQAWNGLPEALLKSNRTYNSSGTEQVGEPYKNEIDNYHQTHYQLFFNHTINKKWKLNITPFYTRGKGYYEQYKANKSLSSIGLPNYINGTDTTKRTDWVRRLWLDNHFVGATYAAQYNRKKAGFTLGGIVSNYEGRHFGEIIWAKKTNALPANYKFYDLPANKREWSNFAKFTYDINSKWQAYADVQQKAVRYNIEGFRDNPNIRVTNNFNFLNPKAGITYTGTYLQVFASYAKAAKEPNRDDFEAGAINQPKAEHLHDFELGASWSKNNIKWSANAYYMLYQNQLVLNGKINDVGAYTRVNIKNSYRLGLELQGAYAINRFLQLNANATLSANKVKNFKEFIDDYDNGGQLEKNYASSTIAFSPSTIINTQVTVKPFKSFDIVLSNRYIGKQYLDNTENSNRKLNAYFVQDALLSYSVESKQIKRATFLFQVNNLFNKKYEANGYTFSYIATTQLITENFYYPMAGANVMLGVNLLF